MSKQNTQTEYWLRGPVTGIPFLLQPVAHALLQVQDEVRSIAEGLSEQLLSQKPGGNASPGFHLKHLTGMLSRLFTYARGEMLNAEQLYYLKNEEIISENENSIELLVGRFEEQVKKALDQLAETTDHQLYQTREVGRAKLPSNTLGLLFHAAEHTQRHIGQLLVTVRILKQQMEKD